MKKLIGTVAVAAMLATAAFAEISFGSWLRAIAAPVAGDGDDIYAGMTNSWGWGTRVARVDINGTSEDERVGFSMQVFNDANNGIANGDNQVIWARPWDWLKVSLGVWDYTTFRGDLCFGSWNWIRPANWIFDDEGLTFDKLGAKNGMQLEITPVEGLMLMWNLPMGGWIASNWDKAYKMLEQSDAAVKYTIADVGTIKAGWGGKGARKYKNKGHAAGYGVVVGDKAQYYASEKDIVLATNELYWKKGIAGSAWDDDSDDAKLLDALENISKDDYFDAVDASGEQKYYGDVNVAFDLTAVENLYLTVGAKISIAESGYKDLLEDDEDFAFLKVAVGASYKILDNLGVSASFGVQTYEKNDPSFQFGVGLDVGLTDTLTLNADFRGLFIGDTEAGESTDPQFSFLVGLQYACSSNGYVGIGFQGSTGGRGFLGNLQHDDDFAWAVPIAVSLWF